jgi:hypothetical protein
VTKYSIILPDLCLDTIIHLFSIVNEKERVIISKILAENAKNSKLPQIIQVKLSTFIGDKN